MNNRGLTLLTGFSFLMWNFHNPTVGVYFDLDIYAHIGIQVLGLMKTFPQNKAVWSFQQRSGKK